MAALITQETRLEADLEPGGRGEFSVWLDDQKIAEKTRTGYPSDAALITAIKAAVE